MVIGKRLSSNEGDEGDEAEAAENRRVSELFSALMTASRGKDFARIEETLAAREARLKEEIERQRYEKTLMEEKHEFERLEKLKAEEELRAKLSEMIKTGAVKGDNVPEKDEGNVVISEPGTNMQRRRSDRLAAAIDGDSAANNGNSGVSSGSAEGDGGLPISGNKGVAKKQMKSKNMEKNKTGSWKRVRGDQVQYRCNMISFFNTMQRVKEHLTEGHLELLRQTPFWPLISAFYNGVISEDQCKKSNTDIGNIIKCYNARTMSFEFGTTSASLTTEDVAEILGLPQEGQEVQQLKGTQKHISGFTKRYFEKETTLSKKMVDNALDAAIKGKRKTDVEDVARLIVIELCATFLLCNTSHVVSWNLVKYCEDLENISRYSWAKAVADLLHESLGKRTKKSNGYSVPGCVVVIMLWLCESTNLIQPINGREVQKPALVKWSVWELHFKLKRIDVADIGLSFKEDKKQQSINEVMEKPLELVRRNERLTAVDRDSTANNIISEVSSASVEGNGGLRILGYRGDAKKMKSKNMEKKNMGSRKRGRGDQVRYRCNMTSFFNTMQRVKEHLTEGHLKLLQQTPFWPLISAFYSGVMSEDQCKKSNTDIGNIIKCYNARTKSFVFGTTSASLTTEDVAEILGLPQEGQEVQQLKGTQKHISGFTKRCFKEETTLSKKMVDNALAAAIKGKRETDVEDVARLILIELCATFLLCNTNHVVSWNLVKYCEDLENISRYSWAKAVADLLHESLGKRTRRSEGYSLPGCVAVITLWLCERTNLIQPISGREGQTPALVKWNVRELHFKLEQIDVEDIGLSFKDKNKKELEKPLEEAKIDGQEDREEGENVLDDTVASSGCEFRAQKTQTKFLSNRTISERLNDNEDLEKRSEDRGEMVQNASVELAEAQGKVNRLTEKLESKNDKTKNLKRKLKEEKEEKKKLKEGYEFLIGQQKSLLESLKSFVEKLEGTLEAEREEVKSLKKDKMEMIKEIQELKDQLNQGGPCTAMQLREDMQIELCPKQLYLTSSEKDTAKRASDPEFENEQGGKKKRRV